VGRWVGGWVGKTTLLTAATPADAAGDALPASGRTPGSLGLSAYGGLLSRPLGYRL
jgi:hypothetical protein